MTSCDHPPLRHLRQSLRMGGALFVVVVFGTILNWPYEGGLESIRASVHARPSATVACGESVVVPVQPPNACPPGAAAVASR